MPLSDNQNWIQDPVTWKQCYRFNTKVYPGSPEPQVLESNRECQDSNHALQKVKSSNHACQKVRSTENKKKLSKMKVFQNILLDNHYCNNTTDQRLKLLRTQEWISLETVFRCKQNNKNWNYNKTTNGEIGRTKKVLLMMKQTMQRIEKYQKYLMR